jgi:hypothetical protein
MPLNFPGGLSYHILTDARISKDDYVNIIRIVNIDGAKSTSYSQNYRQTHPSRELIGIVGISDRERDSFERKPSERF